MKACVTVAYTCDECGEFEVTHAHSRMNERCAMCGGLVEFQSFRGFFFKTSPDVPWACASSHDEKNRLIFDMLPKPPAAEPKPDTTTL